MFIRSERLFLRPGWPEDWEELHQQIASQSIVRNLSRAPWPYEAEHARAFAALPQDPRTPHFLVTLPDAGGARLIGGIGLHRGDEGVELGYWIARGHWNKGYATEASRALLRLAATLGHGAIRAHHFVDNPASARVLAKCGFRPTGQVALRTSFAREQASLAATYAVTLPAAECDNAGEKDPAGQKDAAAKVAGPMRREAA